MTQITRRAFGRAAFSGLISLPLLGALPTAVEAYPENGLQADCFDTGVHHILENVRRQTSVPSISGARITPHSIAAAAVGVRRTDKPDLVTLADRYNLGSCSKSMTATLAGILIDEGRLRWNTTVVEAFPDFAAQIDPSYRTATLEQILSHRAGFPELDNGYDILEALQYTGAPRQQRHDFAAAQLSQPPAERRGAYLYSNAGYVVATAMVENAANKAFEYLLKRLLADPLDLSASFGWPGFNDPGQPWGHVQNDSLFLPLDPNDIANQVTFRQSLAAYLSGQSQTPPTLMEVNEVYNQFAFTSLYAGIGMVALSAPDLARYVQMHLRGILGKKTLLRPETVRRLHTPVGGAIAHSNTDIFYAQGWFDALVDGAPTTFHEGSAGPFVALMVLQPTRGIAAVTLTNGGYPNGGHTVYEAAGRLLGLKNGALEAAVGGV